MLVPAQGGASKKLADGSGPMWSPDGRSIAYINDSQAYLFDVAAGASRKVTDLQGGAGSIKWAPDGSARELVFASDTEAHPELSTNSDLFIVPIAGGAAKRITTRKGADTSPKYSPDGRWIAWRSQARAGYESDLWELWLYDRSNGQTRRL